MTLKEFYKSIPEQPSPKSDWIRKVADRLKVSEMTVRLWVYGRTKPSRPEFYTVLSEMTGIPETELFDEND